MAGNGGRIGTTRSRTTRHIWRSVLARECCYGHDSVVVTGGRTGLVLVYALAVCSCGESEAASADTVTVSAESAADAASESLFGTWVMTSAAVGARRHRW
jgi:hypothetical protein